MDSILDFFEDLVGDSFVIVILAIVLAIIVAIGLFFLFRAITCWYFKINKHVKALNAINTNLERIAIALEQNKVVVPQHTVSAQAPVFPAVAPIPVPAPVKASTPAVEPAPVVAVDPAPVEGPASAPVIATERKCASCGTTLKEGTVFCVNCGAKAEPEA